MNRRLVSVGLALVAGLPAAWAQKPEGRTYAPGRFDAIEISGSADVRFSQGANDQVFVEGGDDVQAGVSVVVRDGRLHIGPSGAWKFWGSRKVRIEVTARDLTRVSISGAADFLAAAPVRADRLSVNISGAGSARLDQLTAESLSFQVSGSGDGQVSGMSKELVLKISGRSEFRGENLRTDRGRVSIAGLGDVEVWAVQELEISVAGAGKVQYWGAPSVRRHVTGAATITDRGAKPEPR